MSLSHLKKQAKNLKSLLPEFIQQHSSRPTLSACQELAAQTHGFPSWHAAQAKFKADGDSSVSGPIKSRLGFHLGVPESRMEYDRNGQEIGVALADSGWFGADPPLFLQLVADAHDEMTDSHDGFNGMSHSELEEMLAITQHLVERTPEFLEGVSYVAGCLTLLERPEEAVQYAMPYLTAANKLIPASFSGRISYFELRNRPYHRLNANLVIALHHTGRHTEAKAICEHMLKLWSNDNLGFRYLLNGIPK